MSFGLAAAASTVSNELPHDVGDFTDRHEALAWLDDLTQPARHGLARALTVGNVAGPAGVGKSALVIHFAHSVAREFPDGVLYANLRESEQPDNLLAGFLRTLGEDDDSLPPTPQERERLYRSLLANKRLLIVLDNVNRENQLRPLLPGSSGCLVLATSRTVLAGLEDVQVLQLPVLGASFALELVARVAGPGRLDSAAEATGELTQLCGGLPLALRIVGARLRSKPHWSPELLAAKLRDERRRLDELRAGDLEVRSAFELTYRELDSIDSTLFRLVSMLGPSFTSDAVAVLAETDRTEVEQRLERLVDAQLLQAVNASRYGFHDLVRLFATERLEQNETPQQRHKALERLLKWYMRRLSRREDFSSWAGVEWLHAEFATILAAATNANNSALFLETIHVAQAWRHLPTQWNQRTLLTYQAFRAARHLRDPQVEAVIAADMGLLLGHVARPFEAIAFFKHAATIFRRLKDWREEADTLLQLAATLRYIGDYPQAQRYCRRARRLALSGGDTELAASADNVLAMTDIKQRRWSAAVKHLTDCVELLHSLGKRDHEAKVLRVLGIANVNAERLSDAESAFRRAMAVRRYPDLGLDWPFMDELELAVQVFDRKLEQCVNNRDVSGWTNTLSQLRLMLISMTGVTKNDELNRWLISLGSPPYFGAKGRRRRPTTYELLSDLDDGGLATYIQRGGRPVRPGDDRSYDLLTVLSGEAFDLFGRYVKNHMRARAAVRRGEPVGLRASSDKDSARDELVRAGLIAAEGADLFQLTSHGRRVGAFLIGAARAWAQSSTLWM